jgi:hypothetical protein
VRQQILGIFLAEMITVIRTGSLAAQEAETKRLFAEYPPLADQFGAAPWNISWKMHVTSTLRLLRKSLNSPVKSSD